MARTTCTRGFAAVVLAILGIGMASCSNPPVAMLDAGAGRTAEAGLAGLAADMALDEVARLVEPAWASADPARDAPPPAPRDWLRNLVGQGGKADPGAPAP